MKMGNYNGWSNYATWRVNFEMFDGFWSPEQVTPDTLEDYADEEMRENAKGLALDYARAFLADVDWREIAEAINENIDEEDEDEEGEE